MKKREPILGRLESRIMNVLWKRASPATVREIQRNLSRKRPIAYTTVMTVMTRLYEKGLLRREQRGRAFAYTAAVSEAEHTARLMRELLSTTANRTDALVHFVHEMKKADRARLLQALAGMQSGKPAAS